MLFLAPEFRALLYSGPNIARGRDNLSMFGVLTLEAFKISFFISGVLTSHDEVSHVALFHSSCVATTIFSVRKAVP